MNRHFKACRVSTVLGKETAPLQCLAVECLSRQSRWQRNAFRASAVHPFVSGGLHRIGALDSALDCSCSHGGVWRATGWDIVQHFLTQQREFDGVIGPASICDEAVRRWGQKILAAAEVSS
jgi:hypothetical protein